jgi:hypothetical protein
VWLVDERGRRTGHPVGASVPEPQSIG